MSLFPRPQRTVRSAPPASKPAVSVVVTLYNYARFVEECLESIAAQTEQSLELVVVDDASTDDGLAVVERWLDVHAARFAGTTLIAHSENMGLSYTRNTAFLAAAADRMFVMDADNALYPRAIERCKAAMDAAGSAGAYTQLELFGERSGLGDADFWSKDRFRSKNYVDATALVAKEAWMKAGGYSQLVANGWEDYDLWCKFVELDLKMTFVPEILCRYRTHAASMSAIESIPNTGALILHMSLRHPWLDLW